MTTYRGLDLDLRAPQTNANPYQAPRENGQDTFAKATWGRAPGQTEFRLGAAGPIWVDDTLLTCCNHAYDVAMAHGAAEVRLEHLVHALTRVDNASQILEQHGIQDAALRRESAQIIASNIPLARPGEAGSPRASIYYTEALQRASERASRTGAAASVSDLLLAMSVMSPDVPGISLLLKYYTAPRTQERVVVREAVREPVREAIREPIRDYVREEARYAAPTAPRYVTEYVPERRPIEAPVYAPRYEYRDDGVHLEVIMRRMDQVETALRMLQSDLSAERRMLSDVVADLQRELTSQRSDSQLFRTSLREEIASLGEQLRQGDGESNATQPILERMTAIEQSLSSGIDDSARHWAHITERLKSVERVVERDTTPDMSPLMQRLDVIEQAVRSEAEAGTRGMIEDRLQMLGRSIGAVSAETTRITSILAERDPVQMLDRLRLIETQVAAQRSEQSETRNALAGEIRSVERSLSNQPNSGAQVQALINERFQTLGRMLDIQRAEFDSALRQPLSARIDAVEQLVQAGQSHQPAIAQALGQALERIAALEGLLSVGNQKQAEAGQMLELSVGEMHEALIKLGSNQQTLAANQQALAATFDEWRQERSGDLGVIENRLRGIETEVRQPMQMLGTISGQLEGMQELVVATARKRSWFKNWLYGTDEVWEASWGTPDRAPPKATVAKAGA